MTSINKRNILILEQKQELNTIIHNMTIEDYILIHNYTRLSNTVTLKPGDKLRFINPYTGSLYIGGTYITTYKSCFIILNNNICYFYYPNNFYILYNTDNCNIEPHVITHITNKIQSFYVTRQIDSTLTLKQTKQRTLKPLNRTKKTISQREFLEDLLFQLEQKCNDK
jgi:hypothetical protein